jgi:hypothetical protein
MNSDYDDMMSSINQSIVAIGMNWTLDNWRLLDRLFEVLLSSGGGLRKSWFTQRESNHTILRCVDFLESSQDENGLVQGPTLPCRMDLGHCSSETIWMG